jgi:bifunctional enzyme CysN/CysC/sulfate adenylyltransferase subunit 1
LRFTTAGSVDDGKSTLIGRLLYDSQSVYDDQLASVRDSRINRSTGPLDFSLLTDGLRAEREQGITIDVAYRYFSTPRRKFIIADTPGHEQYTRNMATGASTADAAVVLMDATKGVLSQSRRHAYIASLLGMRHVIAAVNKMDMVGYSQQVFDRIAHDFLALAERLGLADVYTVPVSALEGDNVVRRSEHMPWFDGPALLEYLEELKVHETESSRPARFPVQYVIRPDSGFRGFAGQVASGVFRPGQPVVALPSGIKTRVKSIVTFEGEAETATAGSSVTLTLEDEVDVSRGDLLAAEDRPPVVSRRFAASMVWLHPTDVDLHKLYVLKHTTRIVRARVTRVNHRVDVDSLVKLEANSLRMNDIASVEVETTLPLYFDLYRETRSMGSFILIDPLTNATVAAGMIEEAIQGDRPADDTVDRTGPVSAEERSARFGHPAALVWVEGNQQAAQQIEHRLFEDGWFAQLVNASDFVEHDVVPVVGALRSAGMIIVLSVSGANAQQDSLREPFGLSAFFEINATDKPTPEVTNETIERLTVWRETHRLKGNGAS